MPGVQKPHCRPCSFQKASCIGMQLAVGGQAFDGEDFAAVGLDGEHGAALDGLAVERHGASAADGRLAADVRTGEAGHFAQVMDEEQARLDFMRDTVFR